MTKTERDEDLFDECTVELFLAAGEGFYEFKINPLGAVLDLHCPREEEEASWQEQARWNAAGLAWTVGVEGETWTAEMRLPWAAVPLLSREEFDGRPCIRGNFCRSGRRADGSYELPSWTPATERFSGLVVMGRILLME